MIRSKGTLLLCGQKPANYRLKIGENCAKHQLSEVLLKKMHQLQEKYAKGMFLTFTFNVQPHLVWVACPNFRHPAQTLGINKILTFAREK